ncbi:MAG TPA: LysM peptidoglycan-binding domain-containing protein [Anaerolineales bacterium]|jgi:hypothetical protein
MQSLRQLGTALITSIVSLGLIIGGLSLALSENAAGSIAPATETLTAEPSLAPAAVTLTPGLPIPTLPPSATQVLFPSATSVIVTTSSPTPPLPTSTLSFGSCGPPFGWVHTYVVQAGDTLFRIAQNYSTTVAALQKANCKGSSTSIKVGEVLWIPNVAPRTPGVTVIPDFSTSTPVPTDPLTETALPFTSSPVPSNTPVPATSTPLPTVTPG